MRRIWAILIIAPLVAWADDRGSDQRLAEVEVTALRPTKEIGVEATKFDSLALKENVALSMADVLTYNTSVYVKNYGRATLSTVAFRGTSPSHTAVTWNGMSINSPMLGMTDFSTIPSYFIDQASLLHGTSSVNEAGGGLGGAVKLATAPGDKEGWGMQYVQGIGSFKTFDEFLRVSYGTERWQTSTRLVYSSSPNDYKYRNYDKRVPVYDPDGNIVDSYHPIERNRSGAYRDFHALQEVYFNGGAAGRFGLNGWYVDSNRELPLLTSDYGVQRDFENRQRERTFRGILSWDLRRSTWRSTLRAGYVHTWMAYDYRRDVGSGELVTMTRSRSRLNTVYGQWEGDYAPNAKWFFNSSLTLNQYFAKTGDGLVGYDKARVGFSGMISAKYKPWSRIGMSVVVREELLGTRWSQPIPAFFVDGLLSPRGNVMLKASVSRNYRQPTLNDLYFLPGGNPSLKDERGFTYDVGASFRCGEGHTVAVEGSANWFDSRIDDWIIWLPTTKGFFSPRNLKRVHAYGVESRAGVTLSPGRGWQVSLNGTYSWTPSINCGEKMSEGDASVGKQLPYVPRHSASATCRLTWRGWGLLYKWCCYSERYTMSSNEYTITGHLPPYYMSNIDFEKNLSFTWADLNVKLAVNNLFNEEYLSVLSRPMPGLNFEVFISFTPHFRRR